MQMGARLKSWRSRRPMVGRLGHERLALIGLLGLHVILGIYYSMAIPIWEAHDEVGHYYFVRYLATEHHLPPPGLTLVEQNDEMHQPPLYYMLAALPVSLVDAGQAIPIRYNPHMYRSQAQGGYNRVVHDLAAEAWPYRGPVLGVHVARLVSVLLGALGLLFTYLAARQLFPAEPWVRWGAALLLAFWPQYRFTTAVVNNDIMVTVCVAAATWLLVRVVMSPQPRARDVLPLGVVTGLALLSKGNGLALIPAVLVVAVGCVVGVGRRKAGSLLGWLAGSLVLGMAVVGWWLAYNLSVGAGVLGGRRSLEWVAGFLAPLRGPEQLHWAVTAPALSQGIQSLWSGFGWNNLGLPLPLFWVALAFSVLALIGLATWLWRRPRRREAAGVAAAGLVAAAVMLTSLVTDLSSGRVSTQGRYLLPGLPPLCLLLSRGWTALLPTRRRSAGWATVGSAMALLALAVPAAWIRPAYALPSPLQEAQLAGYTPLQVTFGGFAELVGYRLEGQFLDQGEPARLSLAWRALRPADADYTVAVQLFAGDRELLGDVHRFPGRGTLATSTWAPGYVFAEEVTIPVGASRPDGPLAWLEVSLYDHRNLVAVPVQDGQGRPLGSSVRLERVRLKSAARPGSSAASAFRFGQAISLTGCRSEAQAVAGVPWLDVELQWAAAERPGEDYTVSLQLRDNQGRIVAQDDGQPRQGELPTSYWLAGEAIADRHTLFLPAGLAAGDYSLYLCLYQPRTMARLLVRDPRGETPAAREVRLLRATVAAKGAAPELVPETALAGAAAEPAEVAQVAAQGRAAVEAALVDGLKAADRELAGGRRDEGLQQLQKRVLGLDACSLPGLFRQVREEEASGADAAILAALRERLQHFELGSIAVPADPRLGLYLGDAMAALVEDGTWTHETLLCVVSYQVWRFSEGRGAPGLARVLEALLQRNPADADLLFFAAERLHRSGALDDAGAMYERVLAADPGYGSAVLRLGAVAEARGELAQARERYEEYRRLVPGDLLGLKRLSEVSAALGTADVPALAEQLAAKTDDRRLVAELLGVPADAVELGPNLVANGGFEEWAGDGPASWAWSPMFSDEPFAAAAYSGAAESLLAFEGKRAVRVDGLWSLPQADKSRPRAGFWYSNWVPQGTNAIAVTAGTPYVLTLDYQSSGAGEGPPAVWLSGEPGVLWDGDYALAVSSGGWRHLVAVAWNRSGLETVVRPLVRFWGLGTVLFDNVQFRQLAVSAAAALQPGEARFLVASADATEK